MKESTIHQTDKFVTFKLLLFYLKSYIPWTEYSCSNWDAQEVVQTGKHKVELNPFHGLPGQLEAPDHIQQIILQQGHHKIHLLVSNKKSMMMREVVKAVH